MTCLISSRVLSTGLFVAAALLGTLPAYASGTDVGRGGDSIALDFKSIANYDVALIEKQSSLFTGIIDLAQLKAKIEKTVISVQDRVFLGEVEKDALNFSNPDRITVGLKRWSALPLNDPRKSALVLHEYVSLMGIDDSAYDVSGRLLSLMKTQTAAFAPIYTCTLIKDPKRMPQYLQTVRVGGKGTSDIGHLQADQMDVQIFIGDGGMGTEVLFTMSDNGTQVGMLELPHVRDYPPTIDLYAIGLDLTFWQVHCSN